jgi:hypothetical protein
MRTTLPLLMGLISALAQAQTSTAPGVPSTPPGTPTPAPAPPPVSGGSPASGATPPTEEPSPFVFGLRQGLVGESNLFRAPTGSPLVRRDRIWSSGVHLGLDKSLGRQRFFLDAEANHNRYNKNEHLNNTDYSANARWDWETVGRLSGLLTAQQRQSLYRDTINGTISLERNQVRSTALGFQARLGLVTLWSFEAGATTSENDYRGVDVDDRDMRQTSYNAGIRYRPSSSLTTRLGVRRTDGRYPGITGTPDEFTRDDIDFITNYNASGASALNSRVSLTRERHTVQTVRDNRGWTGALGWNWRPSGKVYTDIDLVHDRSTGNTDFDSTLTGGESSDTRSINTASFALTWLATAKVSFIPRVSYAHRKLDDSFTTGGTGSATGSDTTVIGGLTMNYTPFDALQLICSVTQERRRVGGETTVSTPYKATIAGCNAEFAIR